MIVKLRAHFAEKTSEETITLNHSAITSQGSYFSIGFSMVPLGLQLPYDLFINSSIVDHHEKFIRIFPKGEALTQADVEAFKKKYRRLYVAESQRSLYLKSLMRVKGKEEKETATVLKDSAIKYLSNIFQHGEEMSTDALNQTIEGCRDVVENMVDVLQEHDIDRLKELIASLSFHDFYTYDHSINVSMYCILIVRLLNPDATREEVVQAGLGGLLHDIGKIKVPTYIINKAGKLTDEEFTLIKKHPDDGCGFLHAPGIILPAGVDAELLQRTIHEHHENYDGTGYPGKIAGEDIHLYARVTAIADFFDAITTKRSYHTELSTEEALTMMKKACGKKIDQVIFDLFAHHTSHYQKDRVTPLELARDFDPCQPHSELPLVRSKAAEPVTEPQNFGGIRVVGKAEEMKGFTGKGNVKVVIEEAAHPSPKNPGQTRKKSA